MNELPFAPSCGVDDLPDVFRRVHGPLAHWAHVCPDAIALQSETQKLTFARLHARVAARAHALRGAVAAELIDVRLGTVDTLVECLAVLEAGGCAALGDPAWPPQVLAAVRESLSALPPMPDGAHEAGDLQPFYIGFTSGSSGQPKGYRRHHRSWVESFLVALRAWGEAARAPVLAPGRMHHSLFLFAALMGLWTGAGAVVQEHFSTERTWADLAAHPGAMLVAVPSQLLLLLAHADRRAPGAPVAAALVLISGARWMRSHTPRLRERLGGARIAEFYGASETSFIAWMWASLEAPEQAVGHAFDGVELCIGETPQQPLPIGEAGRIWVKSAMHFMDYVHARDGSAALREGNWLSVRDVGWLDREGLLHLRGRESRMLVTRGKNLFPEEVEARLMQHAAVAQASVVGVPDELRGQDVHAVLRFHAGAHPPAAELARWCKTVLESYKCPRHWWLLAPDWPQTRSGKTDHGAIARALLAQLSSPAQPGQTVLEPWR